ncbi:hypothetical protein IG631_20439 [Alternaria alternata]|nr:hypothetical protein IG631_20439 [Alternaria alternata]
MSNRAEGDTGRAALFAAAVMGKKWSRAYRWAALQATRAPESSGWLSEMMVA